MEPALQTLTDVLEALIIPILLFEIIWLRRQGHLTWARIKEMLANASSLLFIIPTGALGLFLWLSLFDWIRDVVPYAIPTNWFTVVVAVVLADFIYYWEHRFEHEHRLPWDLYHSVHHSSESYDQTTGLRLGAFDAFLTIGFSLPLVVVGFSPAIALAATGLVVGYQTWIHTESIKKIPRWLEAIFNTASHHRAHHGADEHYLDVNYGGIFIVWDRAFGTFQAETTRPVYGLTTQIESSNPLDVQFSQLRLLVRDLREDTSWKVRLQRLWSPPGWNLEPSSEPQPTSLGEPAADTPFV
ncbi:MAG: sterol desaturase/sphingolipid hydroxylase (fatty acid hydroxylase superfamily) [Verrucomicrobiales bacterium]|jgi:sterol desaturase/sphingolipid hydroxylase (fatty acid hydroxylase superfamily)